LPSQTPVKIARNERSTGHALSRFFRASLTILTCTTSSLAHVEKSPPGTRTEFIKTDGATIYVRVGGKGPAVVLPHGFGDTGDMWAPVAKVLVKDHTVVVPDLRGMGLTGRARARRRKPSTSAPASPIRTSSISTKS